jgi:lysosomal acid lipase/cholesteryl ester hydrolase
MKVEYLILFALVSSVALAEVDNVLKLIKDAGYKGESHEVKTKDGYILKMHRILPTTGNRKKYPVFLQHGIIANSFDFVITGPKIALAYLLADAGYDVWMGNVRGTKYSKYHRKYPPKSKQYWNFGWHEMGLYDLPAMIDFMLKESRSSKTFLIGHSQGTTVTMVMLSTRPEYNDKIIQAHLMAPTILFSHKPHPLMKLLGSQIADGILHSYTFLEFERFLDFGKQLSKAFCSKNKRNSLALCRGLLFGVVGANRKGIEISSVMTNDSSQMKTS